MSYKLTLAALSVMGAVIFVGAPSASAKPGDEVVINPGDTLSIIADAHESTYVRIYNANEHLTSPDVINAGDTVRIPKDDEELPDRFGEYQAAIAAQAAVVQPAATAQVVSQTNTTYTTRSYSSAPVNGSSYYVGNGMWCTDYVHSKRPDVPIYGNAGYNWVGAAQAQGKATGSTPQAGAVAVTNGHVAYVDSVNSDGSYVVSEMGWNYQAGNYNQRTVQPGEFGAFIY